MRHERPFPWVTRALVAIAVLALLAGPSVSATAGGNADGSIETAARDASREADGVKLQALAESKGALGVFLDKSTGEYVVVVPSSGKSTFVASDSSKLSIQVRVETRDIDPATIDRIGDALEAIRPTIKQYSYGFGFDPESGTIVLSSEAPASEFASIEKEFPGKISFRPGVFELASRSNDTEPYSGGAYLNGDMLCTSGFAIDFNAGGRYMVTAGHCNPNGTTTNMGTAWRESPAWPYWDFELIRGKTYRPYVYDSANYTRPVTNAWNPSVGSSYCISGRTSGTSCGWILRKLDQTVCYFDIGECFHNLASFYRPGGGPIQHGDSGGPLWFSYSSPARAGIRGVISGFGYDALEGWNSYATQYQTIADYYVGHAALGN